ncbi:MAG: AMP-binding protein, partial [Thermoanaerobaculia bacterium]
LDTAHPRPAIAAVLAEASIALIVADAGNHALAAELAGDGHAVLDAEEAAASGSGEDPNLPIPPEAGAYIYYTSGSTGRPKGVVDIHRNVLHNVRRYTNSLCIGPEDRLSLIQSCSFSGTVSTLFGALANGAAVFPFDLRSEGTARLADWLAAERITIFHSAPAIFRSLFDGGRRFPDLRLVRLEGDQAFQRDVELYREHLEPGCVLVNGLGATETGLTRQYFIDKKTPPGGSRVPVGYPVEDMRVLLLDDEGGPVAEGATGEIAVQSRYLARGYWKRPDLDRSAFLPDPAGGDARIYRTGDLGRLRPDGCLELSGRKDFRVKIRGQRVEPAEVERALLEVPGVREAVVTGREDRPGEPVLVAYLVASENPAPGSAALRRTLAAALPAACVPAAFVMLDRLPLDGNGKVDRRALPPPAPARPSSFAPPRGSLQRRLARIWEEALAVRPVGNRDDFFELGGDSLCAARVAARIERALRRPVPPALIFAQPTVEKLADALEEEAARFEAGDPLLAIQPGGSKPPLFLIPNRLGELYLLSDLARHLGEDQPLYAYRWIGGAQRRSPPRSLEEMADDGVRRFRRVQEKGPYRLGGLCFGAVVALEMARQLRSAGESIALLALIGISPYDFPSLVDPEALERYLQPRRPLKLGQRVAHHREELSRRTPSEKLAYSAARARSLPRFLRERTRRALDRASGIAGDLAWSAACRWSKIAGRALPARLRDADRISRRAFASYAPEPDPGRVVLVLSQKTRQTYSEDPLSDFRRLSTGNLELHEIPCHDGWMLLEPHVGDLAARLRGYLRGPSIASPVS